MKKILLSIALATVASGAAMAQDAEVTFEKDGLTYTVTSPTTVAVSDIASSTTSAVIPETVANAGTTYTVNAIGRDAFYYSSITSLNIPATIQTIDYGAFRSSKLTSVTFAQGSQLKTVGDYAFSSTLISSIAIPEGVTSIGGSCFFTCNNLVSVSLPSTLTDLGSSCFYKVPISTITLPEGLQAIKRATFLKCANLSSIEIPSTVTEIGDGAFQETPLTSITLPANLKKLGDEAFLGSKLTSITLPASLETIGNGALAGNPCTSVNIAPGNTNFVKVGEAIYNADKSLLVLFTPKATNTVCNVEAGCRGISGGAFWRSNVTKVVLPQGFRAFDEYAFCQAENLTEINIPSSVALFGEESFAGTGITSIEIPEGVTMLTEAVFAQCTSLASVTLPSSMEYIDIRNFWNCTALQNIYCKSSVPPMLETWYEEYESPFYNVPSSCKVHVPANTLDAYQASTWKTAFGNNIVADLPGYFNPTAYNPASDSEVATMDNIVMTFGEAATVVSSNPEITVVEGPLAAGVPVGAPVSVDQWMAVKEGTDGVKLFPADYDGFLTAFNMESGKDYYVVIPAGIVKNAAGELNERTMLHYVGAYAQPQGPEVVSFDPADNATFSVFDGTTINFADNVTANKSKLSQVKFIAGEIVDGVPVGTDATGSDFEEWQITSSAKSPKIWAADMDYYTVSIRLQDNTDYYMIIPEGMFKNAAGIATPQYVLHYSNGVYVGIEEVEPGTPAVYRSGNALCVSADDASAEIFDLAGRRVAAAQVAGEARFELPAGLYIVNVRSNDKNYSVKIRM